VLGPLEAEPALHPLASDLPTIGRFVAQFGKHGVEQPRQRKRRGDDCWLIKRAADSCANLCE
jgi:hypothetical protein